MRVVLALLLACSAALGPGRAALADAPAQPNLWFAGTRLILSHATTVDGDLAVSIHDPGFAGFLARLGATVAWQPGERYVVFTAADRHTVTFTLGDSAYRVGPVASGGRAPFAPYLDGGDVYVSFATVARALYVELVPEQGDTVLQPQLGALDVRQDGPRTIVTLRGATPLRFRKTFESNERVTLTFPGVGTTLSASRQILTAALSVVELATSGNPRNPTTAVTFDGAALSIHAMYPAASPNEVTIAFAPQSIALAGVPIPNDWNGAQTAAAPAAPGPALAPVAVASPAPSFTPAPLPGQPDFGAPAGSTSGASTITAVDVTPSGDGASVHVALSGPALYEWHRLGDDRWYVDFHNVALASAPVDQQLGLPAVQSVRVRQITPGANPVVRLAFTLTGDRAVKIETAADGLDITVEPTLDINFAIAGSGSYGTVAANPDTWKFGTPAPPPPGSNPRLIVIDPGHGGSDSGAMGNGLVEKYLTLDIAKRLRAILVSRGWTVKMTRDRDVDVVAPNDDARTELQGRCDVANNAGARLFVSVHINAFTSPSVNGTTTYYYKPGDETFAADVQHRLMGLLGTQDDGVKRDNLYVVRHTTMPAILVETAFLSNPGDAAKLKNPAFLQDAALGIADGIGDYAGSPTNISPLSSTGDQ